MHSTYSTRAASILLFVVSISRPSFAEDPQATAKANAHMAQARTYFNVCNNKDALAELALANQYSSAPKFRYNLGNMYALLHRPVEALAALEACLQDPAQLDPTLRRMAEERLEEQKALVGVLVITTHVKGAIVKLDGVDVEEAMVGKRLRVASGAHEISAAATDYIPMNRRVEVTGGLAETLVDVQLMPILTQKREELPPEVAITSWRDADARTQDERERWKGYGTTAIVAGSALVAVGATATIWYGLKCRYDCKEGKDPIEDVLTDGTTQVMFPIGIGTTVVGGALTLAGIVWRVRNATPSSTAYVQRGAILPMVGVDGRNFGIGVSGIF